MIDPHAALFKSLSSPSRTAILRHLSQNGEMSVDELTSALELAGPTVSLDLRTLYRRCRVISKPFGSRSLSRSVATHRTATTRLTPNVLNRSFRTSSSTWSSRRRNAGEGDRAA